jgi:hypothetical protein
MEFLFHCARDPKFMNPSHSGCETLSRFWNLSKELFAPANLGFRFHCAADRKFDNVDNATLFSITWDLVSNEGPASRAYLVHLSAC